MVKETNVNEAAGCGLGVGLETLRSRPWRCWRQCPHAGERWETLLTDALDTAVAV
jgi:hypothetical protein